MRYYLLSIALLITFILPAGGQQEIDSLPRAGEVFLGIKNINFLRDNEYFNPVTEGYTLLGYFIQPSVVYFPAHKVRLELGTHILSYAGSDKISEVKLVFSTIWNFSKKSFLTLGTLNGPDKHRMFDPHFNSEFLYTSYSEEGLQIVTERDQIFNDLWLNWENFIFKGDTTREVFTIGESFRYSSAKIADLLSIELPFQIQTKHFGGQISNYEEHPEEYLNIAAGIRLNFDLAATRLGVVGIEYLQFINDEITDTNVKGVSGGYGSWLRLHYNYKSFCFGSWYWKGHNFYSPDGNAIYSSVSEVTEGLVIPDRTVWTNSVNFSFHPFGFLEVYIGYDSYFDLKRSHMDNAITLHLNLEKLIKLTTIN